MLYHMPGEFEVHSSLRRIEETRSQALIVVHLMGHNDDKSSPPSDSAVLLLPHPDCLREFFTEIVLS